MSGSEMRATKKSTYVYSRKSDNEVFDWGLPLKNASSVVYSRIVLQEPGSFKTLNKLIE
jgi:hypothetical protein